MKRLRQQLLLLCCLLFASHAAWAEGVSHLAFEETFSQIKGKGGRDGFFSGTIAQNKVIFDAEGWTVNKDSRIYGAYECIKFGTGSDNGTCTTPEIVLIGTAKTATLTFSAAGWQSSDTNTLTVTANEGVTLTGDTQVTLTNAEWNDYTVNITVTTAKSVQLTFTGKRGFLDDVKVVENVTAINAPTLPDEFFFWPKTTEENATTHIKIVPADSTTVYYTTDDSEPSTTNGKVVTLTTSISITGTTTVKARAYYSTVASDVVTRTYEQGYTVNAINEFRDLSPDSEARLFLKDDENNEARVLHYDESRHQLFLRDRTGALCIDFGETATFNPKPRYSQHVAGWIVGKKVEENGMLKLVPTANTNTNFLALAEPVTEGNEAPHDVHADGLEDNIGNWVTITEARVGSDVTVSNRYGTEVYDQALADLSGIVLADGVIAPFTQDGFHDVVYVIDENEDFVSPTSDIENAVVRLRRTLSKDYWNTFTVPFDLDIAKIGGSVREYDHADGSTMVFKDATSIEAGKPYLVKPSQNIVNPDYEGVTLKATPAQTATYGNYSFVASYSPYQMASDKTELFLTTDGKLGYPNSSSKLKGMRAYIKVPSGEAPTLMVDEDGTTGIKTIDNGELTIDNYYDLQGRKVSHPTKGLYIVNGKKIIIQ